MKKKIRKMKDDFTDLLSNFNRQEFAVMCRRMEVAVVRGTPDIARSILEEYFNQTQAESVTLDDFTAAALSVRTCNALERAGVHKLSQLDSMTDAAIVSIKNIDYPTLLHIRKVLASIKAGTFDGVRLEASQRLDQYVDDADAGIELPAATQCYVDKQTIDEIDSEIRELADKLRNLRSVRERMILSDTSSL